MSGSGSGSGSSSQSGTDAGPITRKGFKRNPYAWTPASTGYSTANRGNVSIDPSIRGIQDKALARIDDLYGQSGQYGDELIGNTRSLRNRFLGNQSDYSEAQMNPLRQQVATRRGELGRSNSLRGIAGSSFGDQSIDSLDFESQRNLQDASANVEMQQLQALTGIDAQMTQQMFGKISSQAQLNGESTQIAKDRLSQELSALGIGLDQVKLMTNGFEAWQNRKYKQNAQSSRTNSNSQSYSSGTGGGDGGIE